MISFRPTRSRGWMMDHLSFENVRVVRVVDGDTLDVDIDLGFYVHIEQRVRLYGVDTPEKYGVKKESEEYKAGVAATEFVEQWLERKVPDLFEHYEYVILNPKPVTMKSYDGKKFRKGKYGRWLVEIIRADGESLNRALVEAGHAEVWEGV